MARLLQFSTTCVPSSDGDCRAIGRLRSGSYCHHLQSGGPISCHSARACSFYGSTASSLRWQLWTRTSERSSPWNRIATAMSMKELQLGVITVQEKEEDRLKGDENRSGTLRVALVCGGPSEERGISLNSARSVLDHLEGGDVSVSCYYMNQKLEPFGIPSALMYSNTPEDFDFKIASTARSFKSQAEFLEHLQATSDIVFPALHGRFGEDGGIQALLESAGLPYIGTGAAAAQVAFDKYDAAAEMAWHGFATLPIFLVENGKVDINRLRGWFEDNNINANSGRVVVKPARSGSSVGVSVAEGLDTAVQHAEALFNKGGNDRVVIEMFAEGALEFTALVLDVGFGNETRPVALFPTEVELSGLDYESDGENETAIFNYRRKYLPTRQVSYHTPPRFSEETINKIRNRAADLFRILNLRDIARVDGWLLPQVGGQSETIIFSDINLMSGMEQTSILFMQASLVGLAHVDILRTLLRRACTRYPTIPLPMSIGSSMSLSNSFAKVDPCTSKQKVFVLFGGDSSERQVSLISGTNVWLNLRAWNDLDVSPFLLAPAEPNGIKPKMGTDRVEDKTVWALPYAAVLRHTVEEVVEGCVENLKSQAIAKVTSLRDRILSDLQGSAKASLLSNEGHMELPSMITLEKFIEEAKQNDAVVFIAVHGSIGENGTLQELLAASGVRHTGSAAEASRLCMDKAATGAAISHLSSQGIYTAAKALRKVHEILQKEDQVWMELKEELKANDLCVKPVGDGCSTGVAKLSCAEDLAAYAKAVQTGQSQIPPGTFLKAHGIIEMPGVPPERLLFEPFIETDHIAVLSSTTGEDSKDGELIWEGKSRWIEVTVGVLGVQGVMHALNPSITVKETGSILTLEEKFQGGTGINLTPPPPSLATEEAIAGCKKRIEIVARTLGLDGFARIDAFMHADTGEVIIIEANTVPGMTPSTVLIHQALAETPAMYPKTFFRKVVDLALQK
ncbi:uncharacterized protein [Physcomitrium patens]|uniref:uncharacterized protein isoform X2 n=1 Tax=Physcomitrium patens TaxID=3218 RepID=UPI000D152999|nr:uncharacterized protein LOC112295254 isoform X2 [Physcomitrium patens]|eukprot:XP_024402324.1 uncharacterized protein LOC112295254 isoform X2 [Physcomitrella patens]